MTPETDELITRIESAAEGSDQLGAEILAHVRGAKLLSFERYADEIWIACEFPDGERCELKYLENPTESIDAALTLVPEGWVVQLFQRQDWRGWVCRLVRTEEWKMIANDDGPWQSTAALALCAAALRARRSV